MKLKWYLRGIGIGVIVTALILHFSLANNNGMTDDEVRERATALGMMDGGVLSSLSVNQADESAVSDNKVTENTVAATTATPLIEATANATATATPSATATVAPIATSTVAPTATPTATPIATPTVAPTATPTVAPTATPTVAPTAIASVAPTSNVHGGDVAITIVSGEGSYTVARKCQEAGLVDSAALFDEFLCNNGYSTTLRVGTHYIPADATENEIAIILTSRGN